MRMQVERSKGDMRERGGKRTPVESGKAKVERHNRKRDKRERGLRDQEIGESREKVGNVK